MRLKARARQRATAAGVVHLHINHLVVDGLSLGRLDTARLQSAVEREVSRAIGVTSLDVWQSGTTVRVSAAPVHLAPNGAGSMWGRQIGRTIAAAVTGRTDRTGHRRGRD